MSELCAAVLDSQLSEFEEIQSLRHAVWKRYAVELSEWAESEGATVMQFPEDREYPAHLFYLLMPEEDSRDSLLSHLRGLGVVGTFHYIPLDSSPAVLLRGHTPRPCVNARTFSSRLVRLPLWAGMDTQSVDRVIEAVTSFRGGVV